MKYPDQDHVAIKCHVDHIKDLSDDDIAKILRRRGHSVKNAKYIMHDSHDEETGIGVWIYRIIK